MKRDVWLHSKCIVWSSDDVDSKDYFCSKCKDTLQEEKRQKSLSGEKRQPFIILTQQQLIYISFQVNNSLIV